MATLTARVLLAAAALAGAACSSGGDDDTLQPLPIAGGTMPPLTAAVTSTSPGTAAPAATSTPAPAATTSTTIEPSGDWDGASFDVGTVVAVTDLAGRRAISFDRYSYTQPGGQTVDAAGLRAEPLVAWWRVSPFSNVRVQLRTFMLADDVEVLTLDPAGRAAACVDPPPAAPPAPRWNATTVDALAGPAAPTTIATLTYSSTGEVTRVRFTAGC
jgi:hypothetical protein